MVKIRRSGLMDHAWSTDDGHLLRLSVDEKFDGFTYDLIVDGQPFSSMRVHSVYASGRQQNGLYSKSNNSGLPTARPFLGPQLVRRVTTIMTVTSLGHLIARVLIANLVGTKVNLAHLMRFQKKIKQKKNKDKKHKKEKKKKKKKKKKKNKESSENNDNGDFFNVRQSQSEGSDDGFAAFTNGKNAAHTHQENASNANGDDFWGDTTAANGNNFNAADGFGGSNEGWENFNSNNANSTTGFHSFDQSDDSATIFASAPGRQDASRQTSSYWDGSRAPP